ncbi:MAG TPA: SNF2-related protein [Clostridiaceae bacterium]
MRKYLFQLDKKLLDFNAMQMDKTLQHLFSYELDSSKEVLISNEKKLSRSFKINREEKLLEGRGIKGFFKDYDSEFLYIEKLAQGEYGVSAWESVNEKMIKSYDVKIDNIIRLETVLKAMSYLKKGDEKWFQIQSKALEFNTSTLKDELISLPYLRDINMYNYQIKTVKAVLTKFRGRALFCDEVGLGKTIEASIAMQEYIMRGLCKKILILVPPSLVEQWLTELKRKFNQDFISSDSPEFKSKGSGAWSHYNKVIASIAIAKRKGNSNIISNIKYDLIIVDEAHHLKNRNTVAWKFVNSLRKKYIFLLTATPVQNNLEELYNLITLLKPGQLKTYSYFKKTFISDKEGLKAKNVDKLKELLSGVMIRNKRSDVDIKFTRRNAVTINTTLSSEERLLYDSLSSFIKMRYTKESKVLTKFVLKNLQEKMGSSFLTLVPTLERLTQNENLDIDEKIAVCNFCDIAKEIAIYENKNNSKAKQLLKIIKEFNDKVIVFTKYKETQKFISTFLRENGFNVAEFHGQLKRREKEEEIEKFKATAQVLVSTEAGGEGRNLQFCNCIINFDLPWNPMAIEQRIGRIHRVGQTRDIYVYNLASKNTLEYYILDLLDRKINMFELVVGEVDMILGDIEDEADFSDIIMDAWVRSEEEKNMEEEIDLIGEKLLENKRQYLKVKELDDNLFGNSFEME